MDIIRLLGVIIVEYPRYLLSSTYDSSRFWNNCIRINVLYTKVLQAIAINYISSDFYYHLNNIPYELSELPVIEHLTCTKIIGSGMISIVLEGVDEKGKNYIVKTKRIGIDNKIMNGLQQINNIAKWLQYIPFISTFPIKFIVNQFENMMLEQLSFSNEIKYHKKFKENNKYNTNIVIPDIIDEYCSPTQIVMTKIEGTHYTNSLIAELRDEYIKYIVEMSCKNLILDGFIHSDLHAGNIIFTPDYKIGIIDFGLMIQLTVKERQSFFDLLRYLSTHDYDKAVSIVISELIEPVHIKKTLTIEQLDTLKKSLIQLYTQIYSIHKSFTVKDILAIIHLLHQYNLTISIVFYKLMFFIVSCQCFIHKLTPIYLHLFMDKIKDIFVELNENEEDE